jgi:glycosyltransferase involved in cell wall biosynthesis
MNNVEKSVCMATYNGSKYIKKQVDSILSQLELTDELIIVDDCSTDNTVNVLESYNDSRIRLYRNEKNFGVLYSFNRALTLSSGNFIFLSDQDDEWLLNKVSYVMGVFDTKDVDIIVHDARIISDRDVISESLFVYAKSSQGLVRNIISNSYTGCCMVFKRSVLHKVLPIPQGVGIYHDAWIGIMCELYNCKVSFEEVCLIEWYRHGQNESRLDRRSMVKVLLSRFNLLIAIITRFRINKNSNFYSRVV